MAVNYTDFEKIWASTSPLTPYSFSDANYKRGWDFVGSTPPSRQMWDSFMQHADEKLQYLYLHEDVPVGHEYFTFNPNVPQGSLPLFGGEYSRETYSALWSWVQQQTGYLKTEAEWQTLATANNGNVPYYSDGDGSTTFRVPALKCYIKAADGTINEVGSYYAAGLPNITGSETTTYSTIRGNVTGALYGSTADTGTNPTTSPTFPNTVTTGRISFDASKSNSIYGNSNTVRPETVVGMWLVKAYGVIQDTGTINEQQYIDDRIATRLPLAGGTMTGAIKGNPLTLTADDGNGNSADLLLSSNGSATWNSNELETVVSIDIDDDMGSAPATAHIKYESGLLICFGNVGNVTTSGTWVTFGSAFSTKPRILAGCYSNSIHVGWAGTSTTGVTLNTTSGSGVSVGYIAIGTWK